MLTASQWFGAPPGIMTSDWAPVPNFFLSENSDKTLLTELAKNQAFPLFMALLRLTATRLFSPSVTFKNKRYLPVWSPRHRGENMAVVGDNCLSVVWGTLHSIWCPALHTLGTPGIIGQFSTSHFPPKPVCEYCHSPRGLRLSSLMGIYVRQILPRFVGMAPPLTGLGNPRSPCHCRYSRYTVTVAPLATLSLSLLSLHFYCHYSCCTVTVATLATLSLSLLSLTVAHCR